MEFRLSDKQHNVSVTLGIARQPTLQRAPVWWDDRPKDPTALAFSNVLWGNGPKYGVERRYQVPKESRAPEFGEAIEAMMREVSEHANQWYAEAGRELDRPRERSRTSVTNSPETWVTHCDDRDARGHPQSACGARCRPSFRGPK